MVLLTTTCLLIITAGGCRSDGRTLRPARADQNASISAPATVAPDDPTLIDPEASNPLIPSTSTLPAAAPPQAIAPWQDGGVIDARYTCDGQNLAPALSWTAAPAGTVEIAITMKDLDAPTFTHWVLAGLSATTITLDEATVPIGAYEATNGVGDVGYTGPCPPAGTTHDYVITVHYLGAATGLEDGSSADGLEAAITTAETAQADVTGTFSRP